jgi:hypothetical protein
MEDPVALIDRLWLVTLTRNEDDAGSGESLNLTINTNGTDITDMNLSGGVHPDQGEADIDPNVYAQKSRGAVDPFESNTLTNSSIRLGIRGDNAWAPQHILLLGGTERGVLALAMETDLTLWLSTDSSEGHLSMPLRLVSAGSSSTVIRRVLLAVYTGSGIDVETDSPIELEINAGGTTVLQRTVPDTSQSDLEQYYGNWYYLDAQTPFTRGDVISSGGIKLRIHGTDAWVPSMVFVYGLDTASGRPNEVVHLSSIPEWTLGTLSTDPSEGTDFKDLPVF